MIMVEAFWSAVLGLGATVPFGLFWWWSLRALSKRTKGGQGADAGESVTTRWRTWEDASGFGSVGSRASLGLGSRGSPSLELRASR